MTFKTNPDLNYCKLSYDFWEHHDSVERGTTVFDMMEFNCPNTYRQLHMRLAIIWECPMIIWIAIQEMKDFVYLMDQNALIKEALWTTTK